MAVLELKNVSKSYGKNEVVNNLNLGINDREFIVLVGPSGCGKSTILRMIAGLEEITSGDFYINGDKMNQVPPGERGVAMVFQDYALYPHMTVYENMAFGLSLNKSISKNEIKSRIHDAEKMLNLNGYLDRKPLALSGGQRQRVAMGRALVKKSDIFLFDEPLSNLDALLRSKMRLEIKRFHLMTKSTVVYVTHDQLEAMTLADKIIIINEGMVEQIGTPEEVYKKPRTLFVASFIGNPSMNLIRANVVKTTSGVVLRSIVDNMELKIEEDNVKLLGDLEEVVVGIRPHDMKFVDEKESNIKAIVQLIEPLGKNAYITCKAGKNDIMVEVSDGGFPLIEDEIYLQINTKKIHYFDPRSGDNLEK